MKKKKTLGNKLAGQRCWKIATFYDDCRYSFCSCDLGLWLVPWHNGNTLYPINKALYAGPV